MNVIVCIDDNFGILFNRRRVSRDKEIIKKIAELTNGEKLWMSEYSKPLFEGADNVAVDNAFLEKIGEGEWCFLESADILPLKENIKTVTLFKYNRKYPSDTKFPKELLSNATLTKTEEFKGNSHEKITMEVYSLE